MKQHAEPSDRNLSDRDWAAFAVRLRGYVARRVDPRSVEDVVGNVLLRLVRHRDSLERAEQPEAWVLRVAASAVADHHRRLAAERRGLDAARAVADTMPEAANAEPEATAAEEIEGCLLPFVRGLPAPYREALLLTEVEGLTQADAAKRLGLSHSGMKSRVQRGRAKLKQVLLRCCAVELDRRGGVAGWERRAGGCACG